MSWLQDFDFRGRKFYFGHEKLSLGQYNFFYSHKSYFKEAFNRKIMLTNDMGFKALYKKQYFQLINIKARKRDALKYTEEILLIKMKHFLLGLAFLGLGFFLCLVVLMAELLYFYLKKFLFQWSK